MERHLTVLSETSAGTPRPAAPARPIVDAQFEAVLSPGTRAASTMSIEAVPVEVAVVQRRHLRPVDAKAPRVVLQLIDDGIIVV